MSKGRERSRTGGSPRGLRGEALVLALRAARERTLAAVNDLDDAQWRVPFDPGIQPVAWDLAHVGWFAEFWMLRGPHRIAHDGIVRADRGARLLPPDEHYDSAQIDHRDRWQIALYPRATLLERLADQLEACCQHARSTTGGDELWSARMSLYHECMHHEALLWTRDRLGYPAVDGYAMPARPSRGGDDRGLPLDGGVQELGRDPAHEFAFDNEQPLSRHRIAPFRIDRTLVTNGQFLEFVTAGGYREPRYWMGPAATYRARIEREHPERWRRAGGQQDGNEFEHRWFAEWRPLALDEPICHLSAFEAEAYCAFRGRRLPSAAEWEHAAAVTANTENTAHGASADFDWGGTVWEWTSTPFAPYPFFRPGPYTTYSAPWFGSQRETRGGAFATDPLLHDRAYRNFFLPFRTDVFTGFRTAVDG